MSRLFSIFYQRWLNRRIPCSKPQGIFLIKNSAFLLYNSVTPLGWISAVLRQANGNALTVAGSINISSILLMISLAKSQLSPFLIGRTYDLGSGHAKCLKSRKKSSKNSRYLVVNSSNKCNDILVADILKEHSETINMAVGNIGNMVKDVKESVNTLGR